MSETSVGRASAWEEARQAAGPRYQTGWLRFCAGVVDSAVLWLVFLPFEWLGRRADAPFGIIALWVVASLVGIAYTVVLHGHYGQTLGKRLLHVRVLDISEGKLSMRQAILRDLPWIVLTVVQWVVVTRMALAGENVWAEIDAHGSTAREMTIPYAILAWSLAEFVTMLFNEKRRAIHDWIAGSVVVRT